MENLNLKRLQKIYYKASYVFIPDNGRESKIYHNQGLYNVVGDFILSVSKRYGKN